MRSPRIRLQHLRAFIAVADEGGFRRAGSRLNSSQSVISRTIKTLEEEIGSRLFDRSKHGVKLSPEGRLLMPFARRALESVEEAVNKACAATRGELGQLIIGYNDISLRTVLPAILVHFCREFPGVDLKLLSRATNEMCPENTQGSISKGQIDVGFVIGPVVDSELDSLLLERDELIVALSKSHRLAKRKVISIAELRNETFLMSISDPWMIYTRRANDLCRKAGFLPRSAISTEDFDTTLTLVAANLGVTLSPRSIASFHSDAIACKSLLEKTEAFDITIVWRKDNASSLLSNFLKSVDTVHGCLQS